MGVVAESALRNGGEVVGVIPQHLVDRELAHSGLTELIVTESMADRKATMTQLADAFIALPGGIGTLEELSEVLSGAQLGLHSKPFALMNVDGYFNHLIEFIDHAVDLGFVTAKSRQLLIVETDSDRIADRIAAALHEGSAADSR